MRYKSVNGRYITKFTQYMLLGSALFICSSIAPADQNLGPMNIDYPFTVPVPFYNIGDLFVYNSGSITGNLFGGKSLNIGINSHYQLNPTNFVTGGGIAGVDYLQIYKGSAFIGNNEITGITAGFVVDAGASVTLNVPITGFGAILNNRGTMYLNANSAINLHTLINSGILYVNGPTSNSASWRNSNIMTIADVLSGYGTITNMQGGTLTFADNADNYNSIINNATFNVSGISVNSAAITNNNLLNISNILTGTGTITNNAGAILTLDDNAEVANTIFNTAGGIFNAAGICAAVTNAGTMNVDFAIAATGAIKNSGTLNLTNSINMPGQDFTNTGAINVIGNQYIDADTVRSPGEINVNIYNATANDSLTVGNVLDLTNNGVININSNFVGLVDVQYSWIILSAPTILIDDTTAVNLPPSLIKIWDIDTSQDFLEVFYSRKTFASVAENDLHAQIATALDNLPTINGAHLHTPLLYAISNTTTQTEYNAAIAQLIPNINGNSHQIAVQNATFTKVETRLTTLRNSALHVPPGMTYGDITRDTAIWAGVFGTIANQKPYSKSLGYHANGSGTIVGMDLFTEKNDIFGLAFAVSNSNVHEASNLQFITRILGFHLLAYGSKNLSSETLFIEWLLTGITNKDKGSRYVNINNNIFSVNSSYRTAQGGIRFNLGQTTYDDTWQFSLIESLSYAILYQPAYNENNSVAALHVNPQRYSNYLTVGGGVRLAIVEDKSWLHGTKELRFMGTYDAISTNQAVTSSFINSVSDFTITNNACRWGFQAGATYTFTFFESMQVQISYDFELRTKYTDNSGEIKFRYLF